MKRVSGCDWTYDSAVRVLVHPGQELHREECHALAFEYSKLLLLLF